jgi:hypothetical protein
MLILLFLQFFSYKETLSGAISLIHDSSRKINKKRGRNRERGALK